MIRSIIRGTAPVWKPIMTALAVAFLAGCIFMILIMG